MSQDDVDQLAAPGTDFAPAASSLVFQAESMLLEL
jgi:hypothetical protein